MKTILSTVLGGLAFCSSFGGAALTVRPIPAPSADPSLVFGFSYSKSGNDAILNVSYSFKVLQDWMFNVFRDTTKYPNDEPGRAAFNTDFDTWLLAIHDKNGSGPANFQLTATSLKNSQSIENLGTFNAYQPTDTVNNSFRLTGSTSDFIISIALNQVPKASLPIQTATETWIDAQYRQYFPVYGRPSDVQINLEEPQVFVFGIFYPQEQLPLFSSGEGTSAGSFSTPTELRLEWNGGMHGSSTSAANVIIAIISCILIFAIFIPPLIIVSRQPHSQKANRAAKEALGKNK